MTPALQTRSGEQLLVTAPTRYYGATSDGHTYSLAAAVDFLADAGFDGLDLSLDSLDPYDDAYRSVLFSVGSRAAARGLTVPMCHLPFYMPSPDEPAAMARFSREVTAGIRAAALLGIPDAVIHPIVRHESRRCRAQWLSENLAFLSPLRELAGRLNVRLCIENMAGKPYAAAPTEAVFGSRADDVRELADRLDASICWDFGHAHITGLCQSEELARLRGRVRVLHIHDNNSTSDSHGIPFSCKGGSTVDWEDAAEGLRLCDFLASSNRCLNLELKSSDLPADRSVRLAHAKDAVESAHKLAHLLNF